MISYMEIPNLDLFWQITCDIQVLQLTKEILLLRRNLATHFREVLGHQRDMVLNRTFDVPYSGRKRPTQDAILRSVTMQIGGSGFRLKSFVINHCLKKKKNIYKSTCHCILSKSNSEHFIKMIYVRLENPTQLCVTWMK